MNGYRPLWAALLLSSLLLATIPVNYGAENPDDGLVAIEWGVRQEISEVIDDLRGQRGQLSTRLDTVAAILERHGMRPFRYNERYQPVSESLAQVMDELGIIEDFIRQFATIAERALSDALASGDESALRQVTVTYPRTPAARRAWRHLADRAWDSGRLGLYVSWAGRAGEEQDPLRRQRLTAARELLAEGVQTQLPDSLDRLSRMWGISSPALRTTDQSSNNQTFHDRDSHDQALAFSQASPTAPLAVSDGRHLALIDPLVGNLVGQPLRIGGGSLVRAPVVSSGDHLPPIAIAAALSENQRLHLVASDHQGNLRWSRDLGLPMGSSSMSAPAIIDQTVAVAAHLFEEDGTSLRLLGFRVSDGQPRFAVTIAKDSSLLRPGWGRNRYDDGRAPLLVSHSGTFAAANHRGVLAILGPDGSLLSLWAPPTGAMAAINAGDFGRSAPPLRRAPRLLSDGHHLVFADGQGAGVSVFTSDPTQGDLHQRRYSGNGSADQLVAAAHGKALLVGRRASLLDLKTNELVWTQPLQGGEGNHWGVIGEQHALVARDTVVSLLRANDGSVLSQRFFPRDSQLTVTDDLLITARNGDFLGYGDNEQFQQRLDRQLRENPDDYRPLIALYGLHRASDHYEQAFTYMVQALERQAPARYADEAASLLRPRLAVRLGREEALNDLARLRELARWQPSLGSEADWWLGRHHESAGDQSAAIAAFRRVLAQPSAHFALSARLRADLHALATAGLARHGASAQPQWLAPSPNKQQAITELTTTTWQAQQSRLGRPLVDHDTIFDFFAGDLHARAVNDGSIRWRRTAADGDPAMLGVRFRGLQGGIHIDVIPGTAAMAAGFKNGDRITAFDGKPILLPDELIKIVAQKRVGEAFSATVERRENDQLTTYQLQGELGAYLMMPSAANGRWLVAQRAYVSEEGGKQIVQPDYQPPEIFLIERESGKQVWRRTLPPTRPGPQHLAPLLTNSHLLLAMGEDLVAFDLSAIAQNADHGDEPAWVLPRAADALRNRTLIGNRFLMLSDEVNHLIRLVELTSGKVLFEIAAEQQDHHLLWDAGDLIIQQNQGNQTFISSWDLSRGLRRWHQESDQLRLVSLYGDTLFAINSARQLIMLERANGRLRRTLADFPLVESISVAGKTAYIHGRESDGQQFIAALGLASGTTRWKRSLPAGSEVRDQPRADLWGVHLELVSLGTPPTVLTLDRDGQLRSVNLVGEGTLIPLANGTLVANSEGLRSDAGHLPQPVSAVPAAILDSERPLPAQISEGQDRLPWQDIPGARYALAFYGNRLALIASMEAGTNQVMMRIGNQGPDIDPHGQRLTLSRGEAPSLNTHLEGWRMSAYHRLSDGEDGSWNGILLLTPPALPQLANPPEVLVTSDRSEPIGPWWLRRLWHPVSTQDAP